VGLREATSVQKTSNIEKEQLQTQLSAAAETESLKVKVREAPPVQKISSTEKK
jgi:hypothetical protein